MAAATENYYNSQNDDPGVVIVEDMTKAVVIHYVSSKMVYGRSSCFFGLPITMLCTMRKLVKEKLYLPCFL